MSPFLLSLGDFPRGWKACSLLQQKPALAVGPSYTHARTHGSFSAAALGVPSLPHCSSFQKPGEKLPAVFTNPLPSLLPSPQLLTEHENTQEHTPGYHSVLSSAVMELIYLCQEGYVLQRKSTNERTGVGAVGEASEEGCLRRDHHFPGKGTGKGSELRMYRQVM